LCYDPPLGGEFVLTGGNMRNFVLTAITVMAVSSHAVAAEVHLSGTYRLVSEQRTIVDTGEVIPTTTSRGYISYGRTDE
jgi:hypothetical protein